MYQNIHVESSARVESRCRAIQNLKKGVRRRNTFDWVWSREKLGCKAIATEARADGSWQRSGPAVVHSVYPRVRPTGEAFIFRCLPVIWHECSCKDHQPTAKGHSSDRWGLNGQYPLRQPQPGHCHRRLIWPCLSVDYMNPKLLCFSAEFEGWTGLNTKVSFQEG